MTDGLSLDLEGDANDYVGKSMEGGRVTVRGFGERVRTGRSATRASTARAAAKAFVRGSAGERFGVRNSGADLVAEGAGDHCCEYMTAGLVAMLGPAGKNFASGMSGGVVFVATGDERFDPAEPGISLGPTTCRLSVCRPDDPDVARLHALLRRYAEATGSSRAAALLADWPRALDRFAKLSPEEPLPEPAASVAASESLAR